jgi:hypothetical protein
VQHGRLNGASGWAQGFIIGTERPPSQKYLAFLGDDSLEDLFSELELTGIWGCEKCANAIIARFREFNTDLPASIFEELVRDLD